MIHLFCLRYSLQLLSFLQDDDENPGLSSLYEKDEIEEDEEDAAEDFEPGSDDDEEGDDDGDEEDDEPDSKRQKTE